MAPVSPWNRERSRYHGHRMKTMEAQFQMGTKFHLLPKNTNKWHPNCFVISIASYSRYGQTHSTYRSKCTDNLICTVTDLSTCLDAPNWPRGDFRAPSGANGSNGEESFWGHWTVPAVRETPPSGCQAVGTHCCHLQGLPGRPPTRHNLSESGRKNTEAWPCSNTN